MSSVDLSGLMLYGVYVPSPIEITPYNIRILVPYPFSQSSDTVYMSNFVDILHVTFHAIQGIDELFCFTLVWLIFRNKSAEVLDKGSFCVFL